jgi:hypothetical protein
MFHPSSSGRFISRSSARHLTQGGDITIPGTDASKSRSSLGWGFWGEGRDIYRIERGGMCYCDLATSSRPFLVGQWEWLVVCGMAGQGEVLLQSLARHQTWIRILHVFTDLTASPSRRWKDRMTLVPCANWARSTNPSPLVSREVR